MSITVIQQRLESYQNKTVLEQEHALKEIAQEIALMALSRAIFFKIAAFQGETSLRILYGLQRFSEDLDFVLDHSDKQFDWHDYLAPMQEEFSAYGFLLEVKEREKLENSIKIAFLKVDSEGGLLILKDSRTNKPKIKIKLEVDTNPPIGSEYELKYLDFPLAYSVKTQNLPSLFAGKCHALLCRNYIKGRDWYDFVWYVSRKTTVNFILLQSALDQAGPWQKRHITVTPQWFIEQLKAKIMTIDWQVAKQDVARFLKPREYSTLDVWSVDYFISRVENLANYM